MNIRTHLLDTTLARKKKRRTPVYGTVCSFENLFPMHCRTKIVPHYSNKFVFLELEIQTGIFSL